MKNGSKLSDEEQQLVKIIMAPNSDAYKLLAAFAEAQMQTENLVFVQWSRNMRSKFASERKSFNTELERFTKKEENTLGFEGAGSAKKGVTLNTIHIDDINIDDNISRELCKSQMLKGSADNVLLVFMKAESQIISTTMMNIPSYFRSETPVIDFVEKASSILPQVSIETAPGKALFTKKFCNQKNKDGLTPLQIILKNMSDPLLEGKKTINETKLKSLVEGLKLVDSQQLDDAFKDAIANQDILRVAALLEAGASTDAYESTKGEYLAKQFVKKPKLDMEGFKKRNGYDDLNALEVAGILVTYNNKKILNAENAKSTNSKDVPSLDRKSNKSDSSSVSSNSNVDVVFKGSPNIPDDSLNQNGTIKEKTPRDRSWRNATTVPPQMLAELSEKPSGNNDSQKAGYTHIEKKKEEVKSVPPPKPPPNVNMQLQQLYKKSGSTSALNPRDPLDEIGGLLKANPVAVENPENTRPKSITPQASNQSGKEPSNSSPSNSPEPIEEKPAVQPKVSDLKKLFEKKMKK